MNHPNWNERQQQLREDEWQLSREAFEVVRAQLIRIRKRPFDKVPIAHLVKLLELASTLGRRATGLPLDAKANQNSFTTCQPPQDESAYRHEVRERINHIYSKPIEELRTHPDFGGANSVEPHFSLHPSRPSTDQKLAADSDTLDGKSDQTLAVPSPGGEGQGEGGADHPSEAPQSKIENPKSEIPINPIDQPKKKRYYNGIYLGNTSFAAMTINGPP